MEKFDSDLQFDEFVRPGEATEVISNHTFRDGRWAALTNLRNVPGGVHKTVVPVDLTDTKFLVITRVDPGARIASHAHDEAITRFIASGSLTLNGKRYTAGDWILVPRGADYEISTDEGYLAVAGYGVPCDDRK